MPLQCVWVVCSVITFLIKLCILSMQVLGACPSALSGGRSLVNGALAWNVESIATSGKAAIHKFWGGDISLDVGRGKRLIKGNQAWPGRVVFFMFHLTVKRGVQVEHGSEITIQFLLKNGSTHRSH